MLLMNFFFVLSAPLRSIGLCKDDPLLQKPQRLFS